MRHLRYNNKNGSGVFINGRIYKSTDEVVGKVFEVNYYANSFPDEWEEVSEEEYLKQEGKLSESTNIKPYYKGKSSLYLFADEYGLNSWEFDAVKRIVRCRHKGNWLEDLEKTKGVIDIYIKECKEKYHDMLQR